VTLKVRTGPAGEVRIAANYQGPQHVNHSRPYTSSAFIPAKAGKVRLSELTVQSLLLAVTWPTAWREPGGSFCRGYLTVP
jgi:hypothetical protein